MIDINDILIHEKNCKNYILHSGGANGSDTIWEKYAMMYNIKVNAYSYKTNYHQSINKVEISESDFNEGISKIKNCNKYLKRYHINKYINLLARNWVQVKYSSELFAIGYIVEPGEKFDKYYNKSIYQEVSGGTGYAVKMNIIENKNTYVFNLKDNKWYKWSFNKLKYIYLPSDKVKLSNGVTNFAGIGTREITKDGIEAIEYFFKNNF